MAALCIHLIELARQQIHSIEATEIRQEITEAVEFLNTSGPRGSKLPTPTASNDLIDALLKTETQMTSKDQLSDNVHAKSSKASIEGKAKGNSEAVPANGDQNGHDYGNENGIQEVIGQSSNALDQILSPTDPLNVYINSLLDPNSSNSDLSPPNFFDVLDGFMPSAPSS